MYYKDLKMKRNDLMLFIVLNLLTAIFTNSHAFGYTTNDEISVLRQMPSSALPGETITVEITFNVGSGIFHPIRGFYFADHIPEELIFETNATTVTLNGSDVPGINEELGASGAVFPGTYPYRLIMETPPDFIEGNQLHGGDELILNYEIRVPHGAADGTIYTFPGYNFVGRLLSNPREDIFGFEDVPEATLEILTGTNTTSTVSSTTTTAVQTTTSTFSSTSSLPVDPTTSTTTPVITTTSLPLSDFVVTVSPSAATIDSHQKITLNPKTHRYGQEIEDCVYEWEIISSNTIGSIIDQGLFEAGINVTGSHLIEYVVVTDVVHGNAFTTVPITINPETIQGNIIGVFPKQLFRSKWVPLSYLIFIIGNQTHFAPSSAVYFNKEDDIVLFDQIRFSSMFGFESLLLGYLTVEPGTEGAVIDLIISTNTEDDRFSVMKRDAIKIAPFPF
jgi:hypothetical protein